MVKYVKCPRCELNYIDSEKQEYCDICIAEIKGNKLQFADLEDEDYEELDSELEQSELCPVCGVNHIRPGEKMCESCKNSQEYEDDEEIDIDNDEEWKNYLEDEDDEDLTVSEELQEEIEEEFAEDEEEYENDDDDFYESEDVDPLADFEDEDYDEDEDDEDADEDDEDF